MFDFLKKLFKKEEEEEQQECRYNNMHEGSCGFSESLPADYWCGSEAFAESGVINRIADS